MKLVGSWRLRQAERIDGASPVLTPNPQGLIVFDSAGHVAEINTRSNRRSWVSNPPTAEEALDSFNTYAGLWGSYRVNEAAKVITYRPAGAVNPNLMGQDLDRSYQLSGDTLVITSHAGESNLEGVMRWTWQRVPPIENLSAEYRKFVGFWQWASEKGFDTKTGELISNTTREPSTIVYSPSGYIAVNFVPANRKKLAGLMATAEEAKASLAGYVGYVAILGLYPGWVVHHTLFPIIPGTNGSLDRAYEMVGDEVRLTFLPMILQGREQTYKVTLRRLSGEKEMFAN